MPLDINNKGQIVGALDFGEGSPRRHAFVWENGVVTRLRAPGIGSSANAINERGEIVGSYTIDIEVGVRAVRWYQGTMTELGILPGGNASSARAINELGQIVGSSNVVPHATAEHPFIWWRGEIHDLIRTGIPQEPGAYVSDINNRGQIVAGGMVYTPA
jgi:probable HAF family extracellular repeat protein